MPKVDITPSSAVVAPGKAAKFTVVFYDNGGNRVGPDEPAQVVPRLVGGRGQLGAVVMKKEGAVFTFRPFSQYCVIEVGGPGVIETPRVEVRGETSTPVMPNSAFEGVAMAVAAESAPVQMAVPAFSTPRAEIDLGGAWKYHPDRNPEAVRPEDYFARPDTDDSEWGAMKVPSNFVLEDKTLNDFFGHVWFRRRFRVEGKVRALHKRFALRFEAVDYLAKVWLNGKLLGSHEGYFAPFEFDITPHLVDGENVLAVRVTNPFDDGMKSAEKEANVSFCEKVWIKGILSYHDTRPGSIELSAADCQTMGTGGIVMPVKLIAHGPVRIEWVRIDTAIEGTPEVPAGVVRARHYMFNYTPDAFSAALAFRVEGAGFDHAGEVTASVSLPPGPSYVDLELRLENPKLWWPWSHPELGGTSLYSASSILFQMEGGSKHKGGIDSVVDSSRNTFGIRSVAMTESGEKPWQWFLNGKRIFFRGTNVIPTIYMSKADEGMARKDVALAKKAWLDGMIVLDHHQPPVFYDVTDREGMPVFQEFTLVWEYSVARHQRENGDPGLLSNVDVAKRMLAEAMMLYHNHPSIMWWSLHDEAFFTFGSFEAGESEIPEKPFAPGEHMPLLMDRSFNRGLDTELAAVASEFDPRRPWHASGNSGDNSTDYYGWYHGVYTDIREHKQVAPIEFGSQAVPYSAEEFMLRKYGAGIWPPADEGMYRKWMFHCLQYPYLSAHIGKTSRYKDFHDWAFASQLYQAVVIKYNTERFRTSRYLPTGSEFYFLFSSWWPSVTWGTLDHHREAMTAYRWLCEYNTPVSVIADPGNGFLKGGAAEIPVVLVNDLHRPISAVCRWKVAETESSFVVRTEPEGAMEGFRNPGWNAEFPDEVFVLDRAGAVLNAVAEGEMTYAIGGDLMSLPKPVSFKLPDFAGKPRHYTLELTLFDQQGARIAGNTYQFCVAGPDPKAFFGPGLTPVPRFKLTIHPARAAGPQKYNLERKYTVRQIAGGVMFGDDPRVVKDLPPGVYTVHYTVRGKSIQKDVLVDSDIEVRLD